MKITIITIIISAIAGIIIPLIMHFSNSKQAPIHIEQTIIGGASNVSKTIRIER